MLTFSKARRECDKTLSEGLVFAHSSRVKKIFRLGHLVLMDATYHTNELNWQTIFAVFARLMCCLVPRRGG